MEVWKPVLGHEGAYEVSNQGRVRSIGRVVVQRVTGYSQSIPERVLRQNPNAKGYMCIALHHQGQQKTMQVARLVAEAFLGPRPAGMHVCHNDGNRTHDALSNLRYDTAAGNYADAIRHGTAPHGETCGHAKLTLQQVIAIKSDTRTQAEIASAFGTTRSNVSAIKRDVSWRRAIAQFKQCPPAPDRRHPPQSRTARGRDKTKAALAAGKH